jgi:hypothetical protein
MNSDMRVQLVDYFQAIRLGSRGPITISDEAFQLFDGIYKSWGELPDSRLITYGSRRQTHLLKLLIVTACADLRTEISAEDVILANTILTYTETYMPKALGEFGKSKNSPVSQTVLETINQGEAIGGITAREIFKAVAQDVDGMNELVNILIKLTSSGKVKSVDSQGQVIFLPVKKKLEVKNEFVNMNLLWEYKLKEAT